MPGKIRASQILALASRSEVFETNENLELVDAGFVESFSRIDHALRKTSWRATLPVDSLTHDEV